MSALPSTTTMDDYLNEQLINCLNLQTNVIQNLSQYSQHISLQLFEIKNNVNILANRIITLEQQQFSIQIRPPPSNPLLFFPPAFQLSSELPANSAPFSFSTTNYEQPSRTAPFVFGPIGSSDGTYLDEDDDDDESPFSLDQLVHLSPAETKTGEEDELILFCECARLYCLDSSINQLKERGTGEMKILQHKTNNLCRVFMRREHVLNICANHLITPESELKPYRNSENAYIWSAIDFTNGEAKHETFCVKFKTDEQARRFARSFNESKGNINDLPLIERISLSDDDVIPLGEMKPTIEQIERARKLQLPLTFYLYENKTPCPGCRGCRDDSPVNEIQSTNFPSGFFPNSALSSLIPIWSSEGVDSSSPKDHRMIIKAKRSLPNNRLPPPPSVAAYEQSPPSEIIRGDDVAATQTNQKKSRNFSGHNPERNSFDNYASEMAENILDHVKQELHKQTEKDNSKSTNSGFSFANFGSTTDFQFSSNRTLTFGSTPKVSFSDLINKSFETNTADDDEPSIPFKPIVRLSSVEENTGEEDENVLFCERAKLYRFDSSANQMKERGTGEMKILQHKTTNLCRVLMRREHVLNICANHFITPQSELKPHQSSQNAYLWSAMDFADGQTKHETLCVKFKTSDIAKRFFEQFNNGKITK